MPRKPKLAKPGRKVVPGDERTARIDVRITEATKAQWLEVASAHGLSVTAMLEEAVAAYASRGDEDRLADLGRKVMALACAFEGPV